MIDENEHLDSTDELSIEVIKSKAVKGIVALTGRTFFLQIISLFSTFLLTVFLSPAQYGTFFLVSAVINFFSFFSDIGLASALIQKKDKLSDDDLKTTFTVQQGLVWGLIIIIFILTPFIKGWYKFDQNSIYLLWALAFSLFCASLKTIPSVILERKLDFGKLIIPQIAENILFNLVAVFFAWKGFGITSFAIAVVIRSAVGLVLMYIIQPWKPGLAFSKSVLRSLFKFGLPYQGNTFLALLKDDGVTAVLGGILGPSFGFLSWAQKWGSAPLRFFMDQVIRVTFPAFSRLQHDSQELSRLASRSIFFVCLLVFPAIVGLIMVAPILTEIIPKYSKWQPALLPLYIICINTFWGAITTPLTNLLNAIGKIHITFKLMIFWTIITWILIPVLSYFYGVVGAALGFAIVGSTSPIAIFIALKSVKINIWENIGKPFLAALFMGFLMFTMRGLLPTNSLSVGLLIVVGLISYFLGAFVLVGKSFGDDVIKIINILKPKR